MIGIWQTPSPLIFIPGLMGSWNKEAILYNKEVDPDSWQLTPIAKEYEGLLTTLDNLGYQKDKDYFVFAYDWRKRLEDLAGDLKGYLERKVLPFNPSSKVNLVGHSLGGLVGRIYAQKYGTDNIGKIITVGSPHKGTALAYKAVEGGELERDDPLMWLGQKIVLQVNRGLKTEREVIEERFPIVKDLLPTYDYLTDDKGNSIAIKDTKIRNDTLLGYNQSLGEVSAYLHSIAGEKGNTIYGYKIGKRSPLDELLGLYPDGRPFSKFFEVGDMVVVSESAKVGDNQLVFDLDHGEIIQKKNVIQRLLGDCGIKCLVDQIFEGAKTKLFPSLIFLILSPAKIEVSFREQVYQEQEGMILVENARPGKYILKVEGLDYGRYTVIMGQITAGFDIWDRIEGVVRPADIDLYEINYDLLSKVTSDDKKYYFKEA